MTNLETVNVVKAQYQQFNQTIQQLYAFDEDGEACELQGNLQFNFPTGELIPRGDGTLTCSATGDLDPATDEEYTINFDGTVLSPVLEGNGQCDPAGATEVYTIPLALLQGAATDGTIQVTAIPGSDLDCDVCDPSGGDPENQVTCTLEFPAS
jgi:hypothetical protein